MLRPGRKHQEAGAPLGGGELRPQLLGDEGHEGMEQLQRPVEHEAGHGAGLGRRRCVAAGKDRLDQLEIPVAIDVPDEVIDGAGRLVEAEGLQGLGDGGKRPLALAGDPAVQRHLGGGRIEAGARHAFVHLGEARGVPQLGGEVAIALDAGRAELDVAPLRRHGGQGEAQRVGAVGVDQVEGIDDVPLRLRHLLALLVADQRVDVDVAEGHLLHHVQAHHHHARDPEEDDVEAGDQHVGRVIACSSGV